MKSITDPPAHPDGEALRPRSIRQLRGPFCGGSAARIPILIICVVPTIRCIAAGALTGSVRVHAATSRRSRIGDARCCSASCACRSTSATGTSSRSAAGATGATTSRSAASAATTAAALGQRGRTDGDCCKQRESEYFSYRHAGLHVGVSFMETASTRIVPIWAMATRSVRCPTKAAISGGGKIDSSGARLNSTPRPPKLAAC